MPDQALSVEPSAQVFSAQLLKELQAAGVAQRRMLPPTHAQFADFTLSYEMYGAGVLSGDFVDFVELADQRVVFLVADVAGHGASAALVTVALKSFVARLCSDNVQTSAKLLSVLNTELHAVKLDLHVCALAGVIDLASSTVQLASAGAFPQPFLWTANSSAGSKAACVDISGKALGLFEAPQYTNHSIPFGVGDRLTIVTDGVLELLPGDTLDDTQAKLASAAALSADQFWCGLGVVPSMGGLDDTTWFTLERHA